MSEPSKEYNARIRVKLSDDLLPSPLLSKADVEAKLTEALDIGGADSAILSVSVSDPSDRRRRR